MPKSKHRKKPKAGSSGQSAMSGGADVTIAETTAEKARSKDRTSPVQFFRQVRDEARKITWTSRNETMISTVMVLIMVVIACIFFFLIDEILRFVIPRILNFTA